jgi:hypothetical protein
MGTHTSFYIPAPIPEDKDWVETLALELEQEALLCTADRFITNLRNTNPIVIEANPLLVKYYQRWARHVRESSCTKWKLYCYYLNNNKLVQRYKGKVYTKVEFPFIFRTNLHDLTITSLEQFKELGLHENSWTIVDNWEELLTEFWTQYPKGIITTG